MIIQMLTIALFALLAAASPGPDFAVVARHALAGRRYPAVAVSSGIATGLVVHSTYCVLGLATVITHSLWMLSVIKLLGASYLMYLGVKSWRASASSLLMVPDMSVHNSIVASFREGFLVNILNPKCAFFMMSIFTLVVRPHTSLFLQSVFALEIVLITLFWFVFLSFTLTLEAVQRKMQLMHRSVMRTMALLLCLLGLSVVFEWFGSVALL